MSEEKTEYTLNPEISENPVMNDLNETLTPPYKPVYQKPITEDKEPAKLTESEIDERFLSFLNADMKELDKITDSYKKFDGVPNIHAKAWLEAYVQGIKHLYTGGSFSSAVDRAMSVWGQKVGIDGQELGAGRPRFSSNASNVISGERALMKASHILGLGAMVQVPLYHTGIWVSIKAPTEAGLLELERRIATEKVSLGRFTGGLVFSNTSVYTVSYAVNFALNHVYDASIKNITPEHLKSIIKITDIPTLIWGLACAMYPNGYKYVRPCTTNPSDCQHLVTGDLQLSKLSWTDNAALSDNQKRHMTRRMDKFSEDDLYRYEDEHQKGNPLTVKLTEDLKMKLRVPTILDYERAGFAWVDGIGKLLEGALSVSLKGKERDDYITNQGRLTSLRQYSHWVEQIFIGEDVIEDIETIELLLGTLSSQEDISNSFFEQVAKYIDNSTISVIAIPKYPCPACGGQQQADVYKDFHPMLLPIDVVRVFFTLLDQRIYKALSKSQL